MKCDIKLYPSKIVSGWAHASSVETVQARVKPSQPKLNIWVLTILAQL